MVEPVSRWGRCFPCMPPYERQADAWLAEAKSGMAPGIPKLLIDALFVAAHPLDYEWRLEKWVQVRRLQTATVPFGDGEAVVYLANRAWMDGLWIDLLTGAAAVDMPFPCLRLRFYNLPE